jgi:hypothetical protein
MRIRLGLRILDLIKIFMPFICRSFFCQPDRLRLERELFLGAKYGARRSSLAGFEHRDLGAVVMTSAGEGLDPDGTRA